MAGFETGQELDVLGGSMFNGPIPQRRKAQLSCEPLNVTEVGLSKN